MTERKNPRAKKGFENKWELKVTDDIKIQRYDDKNFLILERMQNVNPFTGEDSVTWKEQGFYSTIKKALAAIVDKDLLIKTEDIKSLSHYYKSVKKQSEIVRNLIKDAEGL